MDKVLKHLTWHICLVYVDDVIIYSKDYRSHLDNLDQVFMRLREANLKMHPDKCKFMHRQVKYLGYKISQQGTEPSDDKVEVVKKFESPKNTTEIKQFLGLTGYFRDFIKGYAEAATPMTELLKKDTPFVWTKECEESFQLLKQRLISIPILAFPD